MFVIVVKGSGKSKVANHESSLLVDEDISRFEVAVDDVEFMEFVDCVDEFGHILSDEAGREAARRIEDEVIEIAAVHERLFPIDKLERYKCRALCEVRTVMR